MNRILSILFLLSLNSNGIMAQTWQQTPMYGGGYVTGLIPHPTDTDQLYARIDVGGIYHTTDGGDNWSSLTQDIIKDSKRNFQVRSFAIDSNTPNDMYFITGNSQYSTDAALWISSDSGNNWSRQQAPLSIGGNGFARSSGETLVIHPTDNTQLIMGGQPTFDWGTNSFNGDGGLYQYDKTNGQFTALAGNTLDNAWINSIKVHPTNTDLLFISTVVFTINSGTTTNEGLWTYQISTGILTQIKTEEVFDFDFDSGSANTIVTTQSNGISYTTNGGTTWSALNAPFGHDYNYFVTCHPSQANHWFFGYWDAFGANGIVETTDGGNNYYETKYNGGTNQSQVIHPSYANDNYKPGFGNSNSTLIFTDANTAYATDWHGVWKTTDAASDLVTNTTAGNTDNSNWSWTWKTQGIYNLVQVRLSVHPTDANTIYHCLADIGYYTSTDGNTTASHPSLFPITSTYNIQMAPSDPNVGYAVGKHHSGKGRIVRTSDAGSSWVEPVSNFVWGSSYFETNNSAAVTDIQISSVDEDVFIVGIESGSMSNQVYRSNDGGMTYASWDNGITTMGIFKTWTPLDKLIKDANGTTFYIYHQSQLYKRDLSDAAWVSLTNPTGTGWFAQVISHPTDTNILYATQYNNGIYKSIDGGNSWTAIPSNGMRTTAITSYQNRIVVVDGDDANTQKPMNLFYSDDDGLNWNAVGTSGLYSMLNGIRLINPTTLIGWGENTGSARISLPAILPVEWLGFEARFNDRYDAVLNWSTLSETNNKGFEIYHSKDAGHWGKIGYVYGNENTAERTDYEFIHPNPSLGKNYYYLKQLDFSGDFERSEIRILDLIADAFQLYPNPTQDELYITGKGGIPFQIVDLNGRTIYEGITQEGQSRIAVSGWERGTYIWMTSMQTTQFILID